MHFLRNLAKSVLTKASVLNKSLIINIIQCVVTILIVRYSAIAACGQPISFEKKTTGLAVEIMNLAMFLRGVFKGHPVFMI